MSLGTCNVVNEGCKAPPITFDKVDTTCYACGLNVCTNELCSKLAGSTPLACTKRFRNQRICAHCLDEELRLADERRIGDQIATRGDDGAWTTPDGVRWTFCGGAYCKGLRQNTPHPTSCYLDQQNERDLPARCHLRWSGATGAQCCLDARHDGPCRYKCCDPGCPGRLLPASQWPHPTDCATIPTEKR